MTETIDITNAELFNNLLEIKMSGGQLLDLHNEYWCDRIDLIGKAMRVVLRGSESDVDLEHPVLYIEFSDVQIDKMSILDANAGDCIQLETLERIRFDSGNGLIDRTADGLVFFLVELLPDLSFEIRARSASIVVRGQS